MSLRYYAALGEFHLQAGRYGQAIQSMEPLFALKDVVQKDLALFKAKALNDLGIAYMRDGYPNAAK